MKLLKQHQTGLSVIGCRVLLVGGRVSRDSRPRRLHYLLPALACTVRERAPFFLARERAGLCDGRRRVALEEGLRRTSKACSWPWFQCRPRRQGRDPLEHGMGECLVLLRLLEGDSHVIRARVRGAVRVDGGQDLRPVVLCWRSG